MSQFYNVKTNAGDAAIANAIATNTKLNITHVAFGDGNGAVPTPDKLRTTLVNEVHRQAVTKYTQHPTVTKWITVETIIPAATGGFWIREIGIIANGVMITHGSHAPFFKVADTEGVSEYRLKFTIDIHDASVVQLTLDESLIFATQEWINTNYIPRTDLVDNLTTNDAGKPLSAKQGKALQDNKLDANKVGSAGGAASLGVDGYVPDAELKKASTTQAGIVQLVNDITTGGIDKALTAEQGKLFFEMFASYKASRGYQKLPSGLIIQWGEDSGGSTAGSQNVTMPITFPNAILQAVATFNEINSETPFSVGVKTINASTIALRTSSSTNAYVRWLAIGY